MSTLIIQVDLNNYNRQIAVTYEIKTSIVCCGWKMNKNIISTRLTFSKHLLYEFKFHYKSVHFLTFISEDSYKATNWTLKTKESLKRTYLRTNTTILRIKVALINLYDDTKELERT
jgi:hypothetical protein